jgi:toxin ParE1/3/4
VKVVVTAEAHQDLLRIGDYIAADNPVRARSFLRELREAIRQIGEVPRGFPLVPRYETSGIRRRPYGNHLIFYRVESDRVAIAHILHSARDYERILFPEG